MIERTEVSGRPATVAYLDDDFKPVDKDKATLVRVIWDDGNTAWLVKPPKQEEASDRT